MKFVESDVALAGEEATEVPEVARPPRPEHRRVYVSLFVTTSVLIATVALVYGLFPRRDDEVLNQAISHHREVGALALDRPAAAELEAWTLGVLGRSVPWPAQGVVALGARTLRLLNRPAVLIRFQVGSDVVTLVVLPPWDAPDRIFRKRDDELLAVAWRQQGLVFVAVGPEASAARWRPIFGVP